MMSIEHNHGPSIAETAQPSLRKLTAPAIDEARRQFNAGVKPYQVLRSLQQGYDAKITPADLYNIRAKLEQEDLNGRSSIQAL